MKKAIVAAIFATTLTAGSAYYAQAANKGPKFVEFPAKVTTSRNRPPLQLDKPSLFLDEPVKILLEQAYKGPVNFAGHYVFVVWGAGARCETGAALDVETGDVHPLNVAACDWRESDKKPFHFKADSRLFVLSGSVGDGGTKGANYFQFDGGKFSPLVKAKSLLAALFEKDSDERAKQLQEELGNQGMQALEKIEPAAGKNSDVSEVFFNDLWKHSNQDPFRFVVSCYGIITDTMRDGLLKRIGPQKFEPFFVRMGGNLALSPLAFKICDYRIQALKYFNDQQQYADAKSRFKIIAAEMDKKMLRECKTPECKEIARLVFE